MFTVVCFHTYLHVIHLCYLVIDDMYEFDTVCVYRWKTFFLTSGVSNTR